MEQIIVNTLVVGLFPRGKSFLYRHTTKKGNTRQVVLVRDNNGLWSAHYISEAK
jgi:hypothetical protein